MYQVFGGTPAFFVLNLALHILNGVRGFDLESDCFACQRLHEELHASVVGGDNANDRSYCK